MTALNPPPIVHRFKQSEPMWLRCSRGHSVPFAGNPNLLCFDCLSIDENKTTSKVRAEKRARARQEKRHATSGTRATVDEVVEEFVRLYGNADERKVRHAAETYATLLARTRLLGRGRTSDTVEDLIPEATQELVANVKGAQMAKDDSKKPWGYLRGKPEAQAAWERFNDALTEARASGEGVPRCEDNPAPYTDFGGEGFDHGDDLPTSEEAYMMCAECPLLELCGNWAELERPAWGVWAGTLWIGGEEVHD